MNINPPSREGDRPRYVPWTVIAKFRVLDCPCDIGGKRVSRYLAPFITEYVDLLTGEILSPAQAKKSGAWPEIRLGERVLQRQAALATLRPEVRHFALFVLKFRNRRRGITPEIDTLAAWYAAYLNKRIDNIKRYIPRLYEAGILAGRSVLHALFQLAGKDTVATDHLHEDGRAQGILLALLPRPQTGVAVAPDVLPHWIVARDQARDAMRDRVLEHVRNLRGQPQGEFESYECIGSEELHSFRHLKEPPAVVLSA